MNILKLFKGAKFDHDQIKEENVTGFEIFKFFVSDHLKEIDGAAKKQISIQKGSRPSEFTRPLI